MTGTWNLQKLKPNERKGSKARCHWLTHGSRRQIADRLSRLVEPYGTVSTSDRWMPDGFDDPEEARLDRASKLLPNQADRDKLRDWWLAVPGSANTPNWDIASTCSIDGKDGLLLVEAKAHTKELDDSIAGKGLKANASANSRRNHGRIGSSMQEANVALIEQTGICWALSIEHHYQISNRFAWSWKLADRDFPVVLVYLGFLNAKEMRDGNKGQDVFRSHGDWERRVKEHSRPLFPDEVWDNEWTLHGQLFAPRICSWEVPYDAPLE